ncbi:hypothetical protein EV401DRAFT_1312312 [Pisolithus croceorrhizus]|nr:hypothetical protein EV401DRAFT_1312312 [Pisolithus croceorrhizus]
MQGYASDCIANHDTTVPPPYASPLQSYVIGQLLGYPEKSGDVSIFGGLDNSFAGPTMDMGFIPSFHDCTSGRVIGLDVPWSWISNLPLPSLQELHPSDYFTRGVIPLPPEQARTWIVIPPQFLSGFTTQLTEQISPRTPFPYTYPIPSQSNSTSYPTSDNSITSYSPFPMPNQSSSSCSPQEHLGYPFPFKPHYVQPVGLPGFRGFNSGSKKELQTSGALDNHAAQALSDYPSHTLSDHETYLFPSHLTHIPDDYTADGGVDDYGNFDESKLNSEQVVGLRPQLLPPPNQLSLSPHKLHLQDRVSRIKGKGLSGTSCHGRRFVTRRPQTPKRRPKARSVCDRNTSYSCGWRDGSGRICGMPIRYGDFTGHFAAAHGIRNIAWNVKVVCCWCPSEPQREIVRKNFSRHVKEVHLCRPRLESGT